MGMNNTPASDRIHIGFFGRRNAGKSSVLNAVTGQDLAVVSDVKGTTTDPVYKAMELLPLGPVMMIDTPEDILLTSFSILFARYKGSLEPMVRGVRALDRIGKGDRILICEGCTHHRQCEDIGTVKLPGWIREYTGTEPEFVFTSGTEFPDDLAGFRLIVHCGGCMLNEREMKYRMKCAHDQGIPITNYGITIAYVQGILRRSVEPFPEIAALLCGSREG